MSNYPSHFVHLGGRLTTMCVSNTIHKNNLQGNITELWKVNPPKELVELNLQAEDQQGELIVCCLLRSLKPGVALYCTTLHSTTLHLHPLLFILIIRFGAWRQRMLWTER